MTVYRILFFENPKDYSTHESYDGREEIEPDLVDLLFDLYQYLRVEAVKKESNIVSWELNNYWYSSLQIARMVKLKTFTWFLVVNELS